LNPICPNNNTVPRLVSCAVSSVEEAGRSTQIRLSLKPSDINKGMTPASLPEDMLVWGSVSGIEDHGAVIAFGVDGVTGFLKKKEAAAYLKRRGAGAALTVGECMWCCVLPSKLNSPVLKVTVDPVKVAAARVASAHDLNISELVPGLCCDAIVESSTDGKGVVLKFKGFESNVDIFHLPAVHSSEVLEKTYEPKSKATARILFVDESTKAVGLTLRSNLVQPLTWLCEVDRLSLLPFSGGSFARDLT